jgi:hypothetical protein
MMENTDAPTPNNHQPTIFSLPLMTKFSLILLKIIGFSLNTPENALFTTVYELED